MFKSKYADPEDTPLPSSRRKRSRVENTSSAIASSLPGFPVRTLSWDHSAAIEDVPTVKAAPKAPIRNLDPASSGAQEPLVAEESTRDRSVSPLPHVAEIARNQRLPEPTVILSHAPSPKKAAEKAVPQEIVQPSTQVDAQSVTSTLHVPALPATPSPDIISRSDTPRVSGIKKVRSQRGKLCTIKIASDLEKTYHGSSSPLTAEEVEVRVEAFEQAGFDTRGFGSGEIETSLDTLGDQSQARAVFPDQQEMLDEHKQQKFDISVPIKKDWDDYVNHLREEKLRQLGVSMGDEPAPPLLTRQSTSPYPALAFSPPIPGSSATSQHQWQNMGPFSASFSPDLSTNNTSLGSMASPQSFNQMSRPGNLSRQSTFGFHFPGPQYAATSTQQSWSPQRQSTPDGISRGGSPAVAKSPQPPSTTSPSGRREYGHGRPSTPLVDVATNPDEADESGFQNVEQKTSNSSSNERAPTGAQLMGQFADLASPKPQGHHSNISTSLEREAESAQYYPGEYVNEDEEAGISSKSKLDWNSLGASRKTAVGIPAHDPQPEPSHVSKGSSSLNVAAKEFKFDPQSIHTRNFSMSNDALMPSATSKTAKAANATSSVSFATAHSNQGSVSLTNFNVAAPEFKLPAQKNFAFSSNWFNFSKKSELPKEEITPIIEKKEEKKSTLSTSSKIFGGLADIIKPGKKSKAIPIVNPDSIGLATTKDISEGEREDEDGRIERSYESRKRGRRAGTDRDEVPRFAEPTPEPETLPSAATATRDESPRELGSNIGSAELQRHAKVDLELPSARRPLQLEYDLDVNGDFSDSSNVPWHGVDADQDQASHKESLESNPNRLMASSPAPSSLLHGKDLEVFRSSDGEDKPLPYPTQEKDDADKSMYPSFKDANNIADYINNDNSDFGVDDGKLSVETAVGNRSLEPLSSKAEPPSALRNLLSPRPDHFQRRLGGSMADGPYEHQQDHRMMRNSASPVRRLNIMADAPVSDWDDMLSSAEELKIPQQHHTSDAHMASLVEGLLKRHLAPFEKTLKDLGKSLNSRETRGVSRSSRPRSSFNKSDSDADEESEAESDRMPRQGNAKSERRMSHIRSAVKEAMTAAQQDGFGQLEQETRYRKAAEQRADDLRRLLTITEKEIALYKESTANQDDRIRSLEEDKDDALQRNSEVEEELRTKTLDFTSEVAKLENDLDEYRSSSAKWSAEIDTVKHAREALIRTIESMKQDTADNTKERAVLSNKLTSVEEELRIAQERLVSERRDRQHADEDQRRELESFRVQLNEANEVKQKLSAENSNLSEKEVEATKCSIKSSVMLEETQKAKALLDLRFNKLNDKAVEHSTIVARYEREASEAHENTALEVQRTRTLLETDIEIANKKVENIKADLEIRLEMAKSELDNVRRDHDSVRGRYERSLNESIVSRKEAVQEANSNHIKRLQEERERFDQALKELSAQHDRAMRNSHEDKQRSEQHLGSRLEISASKVAHLTDRVAHLEERVLVAQSAAQAAATAAQSAKSLAATNGGVTSSRSINTPAHLDKVSPQALRESIVVLQEQLQEREARIEQLEASANAKAGNAESDDPESQSRLREKEAEVGWLREILNVRLDDLSDLVNNLQLARFDRGAARNAAIRIKANLQMEQQERDRQLDPTRSNAPSPSIPSLTDLQNFASPKAAQLAAAFGNWRRNPPTLAGMREAQGAATPLRPSSGARAGLTSAKGQEMPASLSAGSQGGLRNPMAAAAASNAAKRNDANSFLSGLMTPPASNLHRSASNSATPMQSIPNTARPRTPSRTMSRSGMTSNADSPEKRTKEPSTPELYSKGDYDLDAELGGREIDEEEEEIESPIKKDRMDETADQTRLEPFGEVIAKPGA